MNSDLLEAAAIMNSDLLEAVIMNSDLFGDSLFIDKQNYLHASILKPSDI